MYKYVLNYVVKISMTFAKYFEYYSSILGGAFFVDTLYIGLLTYYIVCHRSAKGNKS